MQQKCDWVNEYDWSDALRQMWRVKKMRNNRAPVTSYIVNSDILMI
jgi:hypothetical protein